MFVQCLGAIASITSNNLSVRVPITALACGTKPGLCNTVRWDGKEEDVKLALF